MNHYQVWLDGEQAFNFYGPKDVTPTDSIVAEMLSATASDHYVVGGAEWNEMIVPDIARINAGDYTLSIITE